MWGKKRPESCKLLESRLNQKETEMKASLRLEYQEIHHWLRHIEFSWWGVGALLIPITVAVMYKGATNLIILVVGGFAVLVVWVGYMKFTKFVLLRELSFMKRLIEIESKLGIEFMTSDDDRFKDIDENKAKKLLSNRFARMFFFECKMAKDYRFPDFMIGIFIVIIFVWIGLLSLNFNELWSYEEGMIVIVQSCDSACVEEIIKGLPHY